MTDTPTPEGRGGDEPPRPRARYDWDKIRFGCYVPFVELSDDVADDEARRLTENARVAGIEYAKRHKLTVSSQRSNNGRTLSLMFRPTSGRAS